MTWNGRRTLEIIANKEERPKRGIVKKKKKKKKKKKTQKPETLGVRQTDSKSFTRKPLGNLGDKADRK